MREFKWDIADQMDGPGQWPDSVVGSYYDMTHEDLVSAMNHDLAKHGLEYVKVNLGFGETDFYALVKLGETPNLAIAPDDERPYWMRPSPGSADETEMKCDNDEALLAFAKDGGWVNKANFEAVTGVTFDELRGKWFQIVHDRVYMAE